MHLWRADIDGSNPVELTREAGDAYPQVTPDGQWVIYRSFKGGNPNLFRISINGGKPVALTNRIVGPPVVSPDGKFIVCSYREVALSVPKLAVISIDGGEPTKTFELPPESDTYRWSSDGRALTYVRTVGGASNFWRQPLDGGPAQQMTHFNSDQIFTADWSREGKWLVYSKGKHVSDAILLSGM
jgi:TolB protein